MRTEQVTRPQNCKLDNDDYDDTTTTWLYVKLTIITVSLWSNHNCQYQRCCLKMSS